MYGTISMNGSGKNAGQKLAVWYKYENHIRWLDGNSWVCSLDLITMVNRHSGQGTTNTSIDKGEEIVVLGMKGLSGFRTESALKHSFGPEYFGFDIDYVPIEQLVG
jgi:DUF917 family protein